MSRNTNRPHRPPPRKKRFPLIRGLLSFTLLVILFLAVGSFFIRGKVIRLLNTRAVANASTVLSRNIPISRNVNFHDAKIESRLTRLGYQKAADLPQHPGEYMKAEDRAFIFMRQANLPGGQIQEPALIQLTLEPHGSISHLTNLKYDKEIDYIWLESEIISLLGDTSTKAISPKRLDAFPSALIHAVLAIEDERFYHHFGIDPIGIFRALLINLQAGKVVQGGSTLTQQLAKGLFLTPERSIKRKLSEFIYAILIETAFSKDKILEFYLNDIFLAQEGNVAIHGFGEAAKSFFGKDVKDLSIAEAALLAGLAKAPSSYSPRKNPDRALERRNLVINKMHELDYITDAEKQQALAEELVVSPPTRNKRLAPYFVDFVQKQITDNLTLSDKEQTLNVFSSLDPEYQLCGNKAVSEGLAEIEKNYPKAKRKKNPLQAALIAVTPADGKILAWVGGRDYGHNQFDRVSQAKRQPGSSFKPFVYLTALDRSLNSYRVARTTSLLDDRPITIENPGSEPWTPKNYEDDFRGQVTVREALTHSLNIPTVELAQKVGIDAVAYTAALFGFGENLPRVPSLALGAGEVSVLDMAGAYTALADGGIKRTLQSIESINSISSNRQLYLFPPEEERIASEPATYVLTNILQSAIESGTGNIVRRLGFTRAVAGKTGTTNDARDAWFAGYTPKLLTIVWVGYDDNAAHGLTGARGAAPIWTSFMKCVEPMEPNISFVAPEGVVFRQIDVQSGLLATPDCPRDKVVTEVFVSGNEPITECNRHSGFDSFIPTVSGNDEFEDLPPPPRNEGKRPPKERKDKTIMDALWNSVF